MIFRFQEEVSHPVKVFVSYLDGKFISFNLSESQQKREYVKIQGEHVEYLLELDMKTDLTTSYTTVEWVRK